ncbi:MULTISPECIES: hypothetical protein [unclassified Frankia]|uniref:hypothetical protein n=1 Tax=unclassified Frankia TaxID=2632575 RepID=UPI002AD372C2|nr:MULTISPECIES: hypothetical protein [unclassified Frankia]
MFLTGVSIVVAAVVPALVAGVGPLPLVAVIAVEQFLLGWAWVRTFAGSIGTLVIVGLAALAADATALLTDSHELGDGAGVIGIAVVAVILGQLARRRASPGTATSDQPVRVTVDMAAGLSGVVIVTLLTGYVDAASIETPTGRAVGPAMVAVGLVGGGLAVLVARACAGFVGGRVARPAGWPLIFRLIGVVAAGAGGAVFGAASGGLTVSDGTAIATVAAAVAVIIDMAVARGVAELRASGDPEFEWPLVAVLPLAVAAVFVYAAAHTLAG